MLAIENAVVVLLDRKANFNASFGVMKSATKSMTLGNRCFVVDSGRGVERLSEGETVRERERLKGESSRLASHLRVAALSRLACRRVNRGRAHLASPSMKVGGPWRRAQMPFELIVVRRMKCGVECGEER